MMKKCGDLFATVGTWTGADGKQHKRKIRCGVLMRDDSSGRMAIRIEAVPVAREWSGWLSVSPETEQGHDG
jgi:hypothetical protein